MELKTKEIYSEVYSLLNLLGDRYISRLPNSLYNLIKNEKLDTYNPQYDGTISLTEQNIKKESISMIALFHLNYWSESNEDKEELMKIFTDNEDNYKVELREKYNPDNLFQKKKKNDYNNNLNEKAVIEIKEKTLIQKILIRIKSLFLKK